MTREEAIRLIENVEFSLSDFLRDAEMDALDLAIEALRGMDVEQAIEWCKDCQHNEVCRYYPYDGCEFKDSSERPKGKWIEVTNGRGGHECSNCHAYAPSYMSGDEHLSDFCPNCGADMRGEEE